MSLRTRLLVGMAFVAAVLVVVAGDRHVDHARPADRPDRRSAGVVLAGGAGRDPWLGEPGGARDGPPGLAAGRRAGAPQRRLPGLRRRRRRTSSPSSPRTSATTSTPRRTSTADDLPTSGSCTFTVDAADGGGTYRVLAQAGRRRHVDHRPPARRRPRTISRLVLVEVVGSLAILAALGLVSWWVVHLGIRPVKEMTATATRIAGGDLTVRVPESAPGTESGELGRRPQHDARQPRAAPRRAGGVGGAAASLRRRRLPRAAHAGHDDPRLRRAVPPRRARRSGGARRRDAPHRAGGGPHRPARRGHAGAGASSTSSARSTSGRST